MDELKDPWMQNYEHDGYIIVAKVEILQYTQKNPKAEGTIRLGLKYFNPRRSASHAHAFSAAGGQSDDCRPQVFPRIS